MGRCAYTLLVVEPYILNFVKCAGALHLKAEQDLQLRHQARYIRRIIEDSSNFEQHEEDLCDKLDSESSILQMVICMSEEGSKRLLRAQYVQSDIAFKRIVGFYEFELVAMDRDANTSTCDESSAY
jgi:hypothetical protein